MRSWRRFWHRPVHERVMLIEAASSFVLCAAALRVFGYRRTQQAFCRPRVAGARRPDGARTPERVAWAVEAAAVRLPFTATCLMRALVGAFMLQRRGWRATLRVGVLPPSLEGSALRSHAWLECDDRVLIGRIDDLEDYAVLTGRLRA